MTQPERMDAFIRMQIMQNNDRLAYAVNYNLPELKAECEEFDRYLRLHPSQQPLTAPILADNGEKRTL